jgi:cephalosporin-C deacetylase
MTYRLQIVLAFVLLSTVSLRVFSQQVALTQPNISGIYKAGEAIKVSICINGIKTDSIQLQVDQNYANIEKWEDLPPPGGKKILFEGSFSKPTSMVFKVRTGTDISTTGFVVEPEKLKPATNRPKDFDDYWKAQKKALGALPMNVQEEPVKRTPSNFKCTDVEINCIGPKPARGYFAKPKDASPASLPIVLFVHAAGVSGSWCLSKPETALKYAQMGKGALAFDLNAHGMLNGQPQEYYDKLEAGELNHYWEIGAENRDENYFRFMYLRLLRALDFLCAQPEWDGKRIIVIGESQGGGQALVAAGLDERVTAAVATVPAMCDFGRTLIGETGGWPNPFSFHKDKEKMMNTFPYFDAVHILKGCKATLVTEIGLIDYTCPAFGIYAATNQAQGKKITLVTPYRGHHLNQKEFQQEWEENVYKPKMEFIADFLE